MDTIKEFMQRHDRIVFQYSGGKDSHATLILLKPYWDRITVLWCNPGDPFPETVEWMARIDAMVPNFVEIHGHTLDWIQQNGFPVDVLPIKDSSFAPLMSHEPQFLLQPFSQCCWENLWKPMMNWALANEVTGIIRGQKLVDNLKSPVKSGDVIQGVEYLFPVEDWTDEDIFSYLGEDIPAHYAEHPAGLDCMACTAYTSERKTLAPYLEKVNPERASLVKAVLGYVRNELTSEISRLGE